MMKTVNSHFDIEKKLKKDIEWFSKKLNVTLLRYLKPLSNKFRKMVMYSLFPGGKRIRPILMFATGEMLGIRKDKLFIPACSIELIHNYSLIHDDLPSMDNDDYRRGKLTVHKKFGEANAILVGDGLLTLSFEILSNWKINHEIFKKVLKLVSNVAGFSGLIKGQFLDLSATTIENKKLKKLLVDICANKTAKLIQASILIPGLVKKLNKKRLSILSEIGYKIGMLFQITDDLIDYISGQDKNKLCYPKVYSIDGTKKIIKLLYEEIVNKIRTNFNNPTQHYFIYLVDKIANRTV